MIRSILLVFMILGCDPFEADVYPTPGDAPPVIELTDVRRIPLDAVIPTDVAQDEGGRWFVLDGYGRRLLGIDLDTGAVTVIPGDSAWSRPVRLSMRRGGGFWMADPGEPGGNPAILQIGVDGRTSHAILPRGNNRTSDIVPVSVLELGGSLVVGDRSGQISWIDPATGDATPTLSHDRDDARFGLISDIIPDGEGFLAADALGARVHVIGPYRVPTGVIGHFGTYAGTMFRPKSLARTLDGDLIVADSDFRSLQVWTGQGAYLGILGVKGEALRPDHPIAVRWDERSGSVLALDALRPELIVGRIDPASLGQARSEAGKRAFRFSLTHLDNTPEGERRFCLQCHDGFVNDSRSGWDPRKKHHPIDVVPERDIPPFFPLTADGRITCSTCHSPHGVVTVEEARGVTNDEDRVALVRHQVPDAAFTRLGLADSGLCLACHGDAPHKESVAAVVAVGSSHPVGAALVAKLRERGDDAATVALAQGSGSCLGCHTPHGAGAEPLLRSEDEGSTCAACHDDHATPGLNHPLGRRVGADVPHPSRGSSLLTARDGGLLCRSCHDLASGRGESLLRLVDGGGSLCLDCHDERKALRTSPHGRVDARGGIVCLGCHDVHGGHAERSFVRTAAVATAGDPLGCLGCHGRGKVAAPAQSRPGEWGHPIVDRSGGARVGVPALEGCESCHDAHSTAVAQDGCAACHLEQGEDAVRGGHGDAVCSDCHPPHQPPPRALSSSDPEANPASFRCLACHGDGSPTRAPKVLATRHPAPVFLPDGRRWAPLGDLPLFGADGVQVAAGKNGDLACASCHFVHGPDGKLPGENLLRHTWKDACAACHGKDALSYFLYFHKPERRGKGALPESIP